MLKLESKQQAWNFICKVYEVAKSNLEEQNLIPKKTGVISSVKITDLDLEYTEIMGFGKYELLEGIHPKTEIIITTDSDHYNKIQSGLANPMRCVLEGTAKVKGIPFKFMRAKTVIEEFRKVYKQLAIDDYVNTGVLK